MANSSIRAFARDSGLSETVMRKYLSGDSTPNVDRLVAIAAAAKVSVEWLATGFGSIKNDVGMPTIAKHEIKEADAVSYATYSKQAINYLDFKRSWLKKNEHNPDKLVWVEVKGDSMEPMLFEGDLVLVDKCERSLTNGKTYVIRVDNELIVKAIQKLPANKIQISSANPMYPPFILDEQQVEEAISIVGQVVSHIHEWR